MGGGGKGKGSGTVNPFDKYGNKYKEDIGAKIKDLFGPGGVNPLENIAAQSLLGYNPGSFYSGALGGGNIGSGGVAGRPKEGSLAGLLGAEESGQFLDPTKNPFYEQLSSSATDAAQKFLNKNIDTLESSFNKASGGVASSSALSSEKGKLAENVTSNLGGEIAGIQEQIYGKERGLQNQAAKLDLSRIGELLGLGGTEQTRGLDEALKFLSLIRQQPNPQQGSLGGTLGGLGGLLGGIAGLLPEAAPAAAAV